MIVRLTSGEVEVRGAPPLKRAAVLAAHPLPEVPTIPAKRADGGVDLWPNPKDPAYLAEVARVEEVRDRALWEFYCLECLPGVEAPGGAEWAQDLAWLGIHPRPGTQGRKLDYVEYELCRTPADVATLRSAFRRANDVPPEDRAAAEEFFGLKWNGEPVREAAERLKRGKLTFLPGWAEFKAAATWRLLPIASEEAPPALRARLPLLYYDLPPSLRARLEVFCELDTLSQALQLDDAWRSKQ